jgi:hypothetical protein
VKAYQKIATEHIDGLADNKVLVHVAVTTLFTLYSQCNTA